MTTRRITITLPEELYQTAQALCHDEHRTQSELFREALRDYAERFIPLHDWQRELLDERRAAYDEDPSALLSWEEIEVQARAALHDGEG
jgi:metal-responsive CopG/Arc/MetJ family transcriptional regulator